MFDVSFLENWMGQMAGLLYIQMSQVSLADLQNENDAERSFRKFKLVCEEVQVKNGHRFQRFFIE